MCSFMNILLEKNEFYRTKIQSTKVFPLEKTKFDKNYFCCGPLNYLKKD